MKASAAISRDDADDAGVRTGEKRLLILKSSCLNEKGESEVVVASLRHPRTGQPASYVYGEHNKLQELHTYVEDHRAWFIGNEIESKGCLYLATPVDPLLIALPYLRKASQDARKVPLEHCLKDPDFPELSRLLDEHILSRNRMQRIADAKGSADLNVWQYNEKKTLQYLTSKVRRLSDALKADRVDTEGGAASGGFIKSMKTTVDDSVYLRFAHGILSDSLEADLSETLAAELKLPKEEPVKKAKGQKREGTATGGSAKKKSRLSEEPLEDYSKDYKKAVAKETPQSAKQKALAKSATGSKNIMSFFKKK